ncbi:MAG: leucine--tRNA ligase [Planctomycetes bacterium]|nr:leucine--tRNA ligase [Planctomycetota bacterium]
MTDYDFRALEEKWRGRWADTRLHHTADQPRRKYTVLEMFAYPSGDIHMGHFRNYTIGDVVARFKMIQGFDVLHPFGWDAFGQPAEGAAIKRGNIHPREWTIQNIETGKKTLQRMALSYDWDREIRTCEPEYYKWTQWIFLQLLKNDLAYPSSSMVNWCPKCETILADEQAAGGCWRCGAGVVKKWIDRCWFFRYSRLAERLLKDIDKLTGWPENVRTMQRNWIGRSEGAEIDFTLDTGEKLGVFTTRPDTIYGVTFMALSPESPLAARFAKENPKVDAYIQTALRRTEAERAKADKDGVFSGHTVTNPFNGEKAQLWVADYVLAGYGTGVVMGVPAHDQRDFEFAKKYGIPIKVVIRPPAEWATATIGIGWIPEMLAGTELESLDQHTLAELFALSLAGPDAIETDPRISLLASIIQSKFLTHPDHFAEAFVDDGVMCNSGPFNGLMNREGIQKTTELAASKGFGRAKVNYKLRDWLISRQRYWGCPIPIIHCARCGAQPVPEKDLPVVLPLDITNFVPRGRSPLADSPAFMKAACPKCGGPAERDTDTMDTFMDSSWYQFRYVDPRNDREIWRKDEITKWAPVDLYVGGVEHATGHCLYFRFITKVLHDLGWCPVDEPALRLFNHGMVLDAKGEVMSKSRGNVVSPQAIMDKYGVDVARLAMFFFAPSRDEIRWMEEGLSGAQRRVFRIWSVMKELAEKTRGFSGTPAQAALSTSYKHMRLEIHAALQKATHSFENDLQFNTVISGVDKALNAYDEAIRKPPANDDERRALREFASILTKVLAPMAPFLGEEFHEWLGGTGSVFRSDWPAVDPEALKTDTIEVPLQVNGKLRGIVTLPSGATEAQLREAALAHDAVRKLLEGKTPRKVIVVAGRLVNVVV